MTNQDYIDYLANLKNRIFKILPLCEENDPHITEYIGSTLIETKGLFDIIPSSKTSVWHIRVVAVLSAISNNYSTEQLHDPLIHKKVIRREILNSLNTIDREIEYYQEIIEKEKTNNELL